MSKRKQIQAKLGTMNAAPVYAMLLSACILSLTIGTSAFAEQELSAAGNAPDAVSQSQPASGLTPEEQELLRVLETGELPNAKPVAGKEAKRDVATEQRMGAETASLPASPSDEQPSGAKSAKPDAKQKSDLKKSEKSAKKQSDKQADKKKAKAQAEPKSSSSGKKPHPVVIAPEPLLPAEDSVYSASSSNNARQADAVSAAETKKVHRIEPMTASNEEEFGEEISPRQSAATGKTGGAKPAMPTQTAVNSKKGTTPAASNRNGVQPVAFTPLVYPGGNLGGMDSALKHYNRGVYYGQRRNWDAAISEYNQALKINESLADALVGLSTASMQTRDWDNAFRYANSALRLKNKFREPSNLTQAYFNLGTVYCVADDYKQAFHYFKKVKEVAPVESKALWNIIEKNCQP